MTLVLLALALFATWSTVAASRASAKVSRASDRLELYNRARFDVSQQESLDQKYRLAPSAAGLTAHAAAGRDLVATLRLLAGSDPALRPRLTPLLSLQETYEAGTVQVFAAEAAHDAGRATSVDVTVADPAITALESEIYSDASQQTVINETAIAALRGSERMLLVATPVAFAFGLLLLALFLRISRTYQNTIEVRAARDALTGLPNRECFYHRGELAVMGDARRDSVTAVLVIDLDRFKELNDTLGHRYGDQLLCQIGPRLTPLLRASDTLARLGGDEFALLLPDIGTASSALAVAERVITALREPFTLDNLRFTIDASCGYATSPHDGIDIDALLQHADVAMYVAKAAHTDAVAYDALLDINTPKRLAILNELPDAIRDGQLTLHYQPKTDIATMAVVGFEALVRWQHPTRGLIPPDDFVPPAEHSGLIKPLTSWVLDTAVRECRHWIDTAGRSDLTVAINVSARNLLDENFPGEVLRALDCHRVPRELITLEVTETAIMADPMRAHAVLKQFHDVGIKLSIDDFGTGYSSLSHLKYLPVDELKIDKSFVMHMNDDHNDFTIVRSVIDLAHNLGIKTVAEGIEDERTLERLNDLGCDIAQGYHLARPMTAADLDTWLATAAAVRTASATRPL